ncbi:hypothetical protein SKTS_16720 [Sulfurimicrobium lacus]|uniref:Uncharacterized protein n=1 Tax=Sulfurimicrobium lacus TaxID=2715678 RepID=A0A6F8VCP7_9PROT|nr:hypothetical protein [Sulfurimicrobium lacus]BCB26786.1 hypothetical protein SKTS_16720 [Sulfurimicrobium lacus]
MRFVIDETSWRFDGLETDQCIEFLESMLDQLDIALDQGHSTCYSDELFNTIVYQDKCFYDLYASDSPLYISRDIQERIASIFYGLSKWQDISSDWPSSFEIQVDGEPKEVAASVAWAHVQSFQNPPHHIACVVFSGGRRSGRFDVTVDMKKIPIWFVAGSQSYVDFFRWLIVEKTKNPAEMEEFAPSAFPALDFVGGAFNGIKNMSKPYLELVGPLVRHLGAMSDHGKRIFLGPRTQVAAEFGALGVDVSDENGKTKGNSEARKERTIEIDGREIVFWWHSKLERHLDRIHFNPDKIASG